MTIRLSESKPPQDVLPSPCGHLMNHESTQLIVQNWRIEGAGHETSIMIGSKTDKLKPAGSAETDHIRELSLLTNIPPMSY